MRDPGDPRRYGGFLKVDAKRAHDVGGNGVGTHAYMLTRYGVSPEEDVDTAVAKLKARAPHLANLLQEVTQRGL